MNAPASPKIAAWARHIAYLRAARTFIEACDAEGIPVLPVKGIVASCTLYEDPADRELRDVDVRVRKKDYVRVGALARKRGWHIREVKRAYYNYVFDFDGVEVDVECTVGPPHVCALTIDAMIERASHSNIFGFRALVPDFTDHVVLQVVNVFKDKLVLARAAALDDLERLTRHASFDAHTIATHLRDGRVATLGWIVADHAARKLGISRWADVRDALGPLRRPLYARAIRFTHSRPDGLAAIVLARGASDAPLARLRAMITMSVDALERRRPSHSPRRLW